MDAMEWETGHFLNVDSTCLRSMTSARLSKKFVTIIGLSCITFSWRDFYIQLIGLKRGWLIQEVWQLVQWWVTLLDWEIDI
nr:hypothetical protein Iba_chr03aCG10770 [Ipomoea batatas]